MKRFAALILSSVLWCPVLTRADETAPEIKPDIVYGHKMGMALTCDVIKPKTGNGAGVLFMVSGGWVSMYAPPEQMLSFGKALGFQALLDKGFTLFIVRHGSSPLFKVPECVADVRLAVRFIRSHAADYSVDPARLGVFGASAGGHLSLMLGTTGDDGNPDSKNPLEKVSDRVAAVVAIFPPTELKSYVESEKFRQQFPALQFDASQWKSVSPLEHVTSDDAPTLLLHGGKDTLVPDKHSKEILKAFQDKKVPTDLIMFPDAGHGFGAADGAKSAAATVAWFEKYLAKAPALAKPEGPAKPEAPSTKSQAP
ncbi:MAG TPA: alpha/beta hydrolase [Verrucomicrobiales bacterium]|nr:alpha/beta hydrolase [Verrucomicrobiales bacterium]